MILTKILLLGLMALQSPHDIASLGNWGPYSKEYYGISHIDDLQSGLKVEFCVVPGQYRRNFKVPYALYETDVHPWRVSPDMKHICYRQEIEWKDLQYVDVTYHIIDSARVVVEAHCVNNTDKIQSINLQLAARLSAEAKGPWAKPEDISAEEFFAPQLTVNENSFIVKYPPVNSYYGVAWNYPLSQTREFLCANLEHLMPHKAHDHVRTKIKGDKQGHYTANFLRPITLAPRSDTTIWQLIACGTKEYVKSELTSFHKQEIHPSRESDDFGGYLPQAGKYAFGEQLIEATMLTNVVYPVNAYGSPIRHFGPGKLWNSLYTWDCGIIAWAMGHVNPMRAYEIIRQYTTSPEEEAAFVHHGTPLATQIFAIGDILTALGGDEAALQEIYPRLKRFYDEMTGPKYRKASGLLITWKLFYNSGGWDDYPPQWYVRQNKELKDIVAPMVQTAYYIRCAKILRMAASHLGYRRDVKQYDADIASMSSGILDNAWDSSAGYFSYVLHDEQGRAVEQFLTPDGDNFNMGLDGVSPLVAGIVTPEQRGKLLSHLFTEGELWSDCGITAVDQRAPYYRTDGYWNGTVWLPHQMILWKTMLDLGLKDRARRIAFKAFEKWNEECEDSYNCYEHFVIESGRGGGWYNFSGLSTPMINWFCSYFKPGTVSTGFEVMVSSPQWSEDKSSFQATLKFDKYSAGPYTSLLLCMKSGLKYKVLINGKETLYSSPYDGLLEIDVPLTPKSRLVVMPVSG
jgi:hypothetical protein